VPGTDSWIDAAAAADKLGVKPATLYSYVSRGLLHPRRQGNGRRSLFDAAEVESLRRRAHPDRDERQLAFLSAVTALGDDRPYYRGRDALGLAAAAHFEDVATWLWTGVDPGSDDTPVWASLQPGVGAATQAQSALPDGVLPLDRLQLIVTTLAVTDPMRFNLDTAAVVATGRALIAGMVDALPALSRRRRNGDTIADRLWPKLTAAAPDPALVRVLEAALIVLADHELAASTVAARVAASVKADPYAVVSAAIGVVGGAMHGGASLGAERMLAQVRTPTDAPRVIGDRLRNGERIPGAGHAVYRHGDARGVLLLELLREAVPGHPVLAAADAVLAELHARGLPHPNVDFSLAAFTTVAKMQLGAGEAIFAIARTVGWLAHALEEYERPSPLRPRAVYVGPAPA